MTEFDAVLFDAGGVLVLPEPARAHAVLGPFGAATDDATMLAAHFTGTHAMDLARSHGDHADRDAYAAAYVRAAGVPDHRHEDAKAALAADFGPDWWVRPMAGAAEVLAGLAARGVPIGIVSNAYGQVERDLARLGICAVPADGQDGVTPVRCVVDSSVVGVRKPDPAIFTHAFDALGLPASERIAYVGDTVFFDVRASAAAGLTPLLHDPYGRHRADPHPSGPHRRLGDLAELLDLV
jgi:putative hydrolase of the HAD superfamily